MGSVMRETAQQRARSSGARARAAFGASPDFMAPLLAGARARGIADAFEMLGQGIVMLDGAGRVLFASARARETMQGAVSIVADHLVGATPESNDAINLLIERALSGAGETIPAVLAEAGGRRLAIRPAVLPRETNSSMQLMKAVLCVSAI